MKVFISGPITNVPNYKENFARAEEYLKSQGHVVLNPTVYPAGMTLQDYMSLGLAMINCVDAILLLDGWHLSRGARIEYEYAAYCSKEIWQEAEYCNYEH